MMISPMTRTLVFGNASIAPARDTGFRSKTISLSIVAKSPSLRLIMNQFGR